MKLSLNKSVQDTDIPVKILKENADYFAEHICLQFNETICSSKFPTSFKFANVTPVFKQVSRNQKDNLDQSTSYESFQKYLENLSADNFQIILIIFFRSFNAVLEKAIANSIVYFY